jgi:hypothetical protein
MPVLVGQIAVEDSSNRTLVGANTFDRASGGALVIPAGSSFPGSPVAGEFFWRTDEAKLYRRNSGNTAWDATSYVHSNAAHDPDMLTVGSNRSDGNLDVLTDGDEDNDVDPLHLHVCRDKSRAYLWCDFYGRGMDTDLWNIVLSGTGSVVDYSVYFQGGQCRFTSGGAASRYARLTANGKRNWRTSSVVLEVRLRCGHTADCSQQLKLTDTGGSENAIEFFRTGTGNWLARTTLAGSVQETDTLVAGDTSWHIFKIVSNGSSVVYSIDGVTKATHTTSLPDVGAEFYYTQTTTAGSAIRVSVLDWVEISGVRETVT